MHLSNSDNVISFGAALDRQAAKAAGTVDYFGNEENYQLLRQAYIDGGKSEVSALVEPLLISECRARGRAMGLQDADWEDAKQTLAARLFLTDAGIIKYLRDPRNNSLSTDEECVVAWLKYAKAISSNDFKLAFVRSLLKTFAEENEHTALREWLNDAAHPALTPEVAQSVHELKESFVFIAAGRSEDERQSFEKLNRWFKKSAAPLAVQQCVQDWLNDAACELSPEDRQTVRQWLRYPCAAFPPQHIASVESWLSMPGRITADTKGLHYEARQRTTWLSDQVENVLRDKLEEKIKKGAVLSTDSALPGQDDDRTLIDTITDDRAGVERLATAGMALEDALETLLSLPMHTRTDPRTVINNAYALLYKAIRPDASYETFCARLNSLTVQDMYLEMLQMLSYFQIDRLRIAHILAACFKAFKAKHHAKNNTLVNEKPVSTDRMQHVQSEMAQKMRNKDGDFLDYLLLL